MEVKLLEVLTTYDLKKRKTFHLSISLWNKIFNILSPNLSGMQTLIVIAFYEPSHTKLIYKRRYIPHPFLIDPLNCPFKVDEEYCLTPGCVKAAAVVLNMYDSTVVRTRKYCTFCQTYSNVSGNNSEFFFINGCTIFHFFGILKLIVLCFNILVCSP